MGVYAVTGGSSGIGAKVVEQLKAQGHEVINIDLKNGDIEANLATPEGREHVIKTLHEMHPEGLDGMICNAGVSGACGNFKLIISLNYFGAVRIARGVYDLLKKKKGSCVVTVSNTISQGAGRMDIADLLNNIGDEERICNLVGQMDHSNLSIGNSLYVATKYALARFVRRTAATWAANGVRINAVAPGNVQTAMTAGMSDQAKAALVALPIPMRYNQESLMEPEEIASIITFLSSNVARGICGNVVFVDGGTDALLNTEKVY